MSEWQKYQIKNICRINAQTIKKSEIPPLVRYLETSGAENGRIVAIESIDTTQQTLPSRAQRKVKDKTIVYSMVRPNLEHFAFIPPEFADLIVSTGFCTLDVYAEDVDPLYLFYSLTRPEVTSHLHTIAATNVSSYPALNPDDIGELELVFPKDINEQKRVAALLSLLDRKITINCSANAELDTMAKLLYEYWFVQFDFPDKNGRPYKSSGGAMEYNAALKREIPVGWGPGVIGDYVTLIRGVTFSKELSSSVVRPGYLPVLRATNIANSNLVIDDLIYVPREFVSNDQMVNENDIVITMSSGSKDHIGKNTMAFYNTNCAFGAFCSKVLIKKNATHFIYFHLQSEDFNTRIRNVCLGTNINNLKKEHITLAEICAPPDDLLCQYEKKIFNWYRKISNNAKQNIELHSFRDWLLPLLMNGQVKVKAAAQKSPSPIAIPAVARSTKKQIDYGLQLAFVALQQSGGYIKLNAIADIFAALGSPSEMSGMVPDSEAKSAWQKNMPNLPVNNKLLTATIDQLIEYGLVALRTVNGAKELVMIGDWPVEETDDKWIDLDAHLAMQAIANWDERIRIQNQLFIEFRKLFDEAQFAVAA